jgi:hypothetical protein
VGGAGARRYAACRRRRRSARRFSNANATAAPARDATRTVSATGLGGPSDHRLDRHPHPGAIIQVARPAYEASMIPLSSSRTQLRALRAPSERA